MRPAISSNNISARALVLTTYWHWPLNCYVPRIIQHHDNRDRSFWLRYPAYSLRMFYDGCSLSTRALSSAGEWDTSESGFRFRSQSWTSIWGICISCIHEDRSGNIGEHQTELQNTYFSGIPVVRLYTRRIQEQSNTENIPNFKFSTKVQSELKCSCTGQIFVIWWQQRDSGELNHADAN